MVMMAVMLSFTMIAAPADAIVGGSIDGNEHPNVGALLGLDPDTGDYFLFCSGTLISPTVFLTASHCTLALASIQESDRAWVTFDPAFDADTVTALPGTMHSNPAYGHDFAHLGDVAVVVLDAPVAGITPASLPTENLLDSLNATRELRTTRFTAVGYGTSRTGPTGGPHAIFFDGQRRFANQSFSALNENWLRLSMNVSTGSGGTCFGDSGGPHFVGEGANETDVVAAVTVTGDSVCRATDVDYRVDTPSARVFLGQFVALP
jgi:secreted trypsin-like serine protease